MMPSYRIAFYVSGHGFGHTSRTIEVIHALFRLDPRISIAVRTSAPRRLFERTLATAGSGGGAGPVIDFGELECDTGMVQIDSLTIDEAESIRQAKLFHADLPAKAGAEAAFLKRAAIDLVVGDIPPLAFAAAAAAGVRSAAIGNFTWDWIYESFPEHAPDAVVRTIRSAYQTAACALRLPMAGGFAGLDAIARDIPFIARRSHREPGGVRHTLGLPRDKPLVLMSFGGYGLVGLHGTTLAQLKDYVIVTTESPSRTHDIAASAGVVRISEAHLYGSGLRYEDLVHAADVVMTKPGYGIISEAIANDTAIVYTSRGRFPEYDVMVREMPKYLRAEYIAQDDLLAGRWLPALERVLSLPPPASKPSLNGAEVAATELLNS